VNCGNSEKLILFMLCEIYERVVSRTVSILLLLKSHSQRNYWGVARNSGHLDAIESSKSVIPSQYYLGMWSYLRARFGALTPAEKSVSKRR